MPFRFFLVSLLILLGGILSVPAAIAVWQEREIQDEDAFVSTVQEVFQNEEVQTVVAARLTDAIMTRTDLQTQITDGLENLQERAGDNAPAGIPFLAGPITRLATDTINRLCLRFLESDAFQQVLETSARTMHRAVMAVVSNDRGLLDETDGKVILNLRPVIERVIEQLAGERAEQAIKNLDIPEDAGMIVISEEAQHPWLWDIVRWVDDFNPVIPIIAALIFLLAIAVAKSRRRAVIASGATLAVVAGLTLLALGVPIKELATTWPPRPEGQDAAKQVYDILLDDFRRQQSFVVLLGLGMVTVGYAAGDRRLVAFVRSAARRRDTGDAGTLVRERAGILRVAGLGIAAVILLLLPDPGLRTTITVVGLTALYLFVIWMFASDSDSAVSLRTRLANSLVADVEQPVTQTGFIGWVGRHAGALRLVGIVVSACLVLFVWDLSVRGFVVIVSTVLLYFAAVEWGSSAARQPLLPDDDSPGA